MIVFELIRFDCVLLFVIKGVSKEFPNALVDFNFSWVYRF